MAIVIDPYNSGVASGKVGSQVASRNKSGVIIRRQAKPVNPRSASQTSRRYTFTYVQRQFLSLTPAELNEWTQFAASYTVQNRVGQSVNNQAQNWYIGLNTRLHDAGFSLITSPPINPEPTFLPVLTFTQTGGGSILFSSNLTIQTNQSIWLNASGNTTRTRIFKSGGMRNVSIFTQTTTILSGATAINSAYLSFGDSARQIEWFAVDEFGRSTAPVRVTIYPTS